jgi:formamidopyrimidine-DNA glycosylase
VTSVERLSKYLLIVLDDGGRILLHLGMSGRLFFHEDETYAPEKHDHVVITFAGKRGSDHLRLVFNDARRFGVLDYLPPSKNEKRNAHKLLDALGIDPLSDALTPAWLSQATAGRKTPMKAFLMDQKFIAGLGNIYVCEALFRAKISPKRQAGEVTAAEAKKLVTAIRAVLGEAIAAGGSSLRDYVQTDGELGYFQNKFRVYGREGAPCRACKNPIARITQSGRSTFYCPHCQK